MNNRCYAVLFLICLFLTACGQKNESLEQRVTKLEKRLDTLMNQRQPTAKELFELRSKCVALGEKILKNNVVGSALTQSQVSHYDTKTGRCYVELTVQNADLSKPMTIYSRYLIDGQTEEQLAFTKIKDGKKSGMVFKKGIYGFDEAGEYIGEMMKDE
jgi:hypothetical protein